MNKLFIGNLHWNIRRPQLKEHFAQRGEVVYASVALDRESNRSRWFGFVTFENAEDAEKAKEEANEQELEGRPMYIDFARTREEGEWSTEDQPTEFVEQETPTEETELQAA